jgi:hypothetical protein
MSGRRRLAFAVMRGCYWLVERIDRAAVPKMSPWAFTFEKGRGAVFNDTGCSSRLKGARLMYLDDDEYERAFTDSDSYGGDR